MRLTDKRDDDADVADGNLDHRDLLDLDEPRIQVPRAGQQDLLLQSAPPAAVQKCLRLLEVVVTGNGRPGNFAGFDGLPVERGDNANHVWFDAMQRELLRHHAVLHGAGRCDDGEQCSVDAIRSRCEDSELAAFLAAVGEEFPRVLEVIAINDLAEDALGGDRRAVRRKHQRDLALRHDGDRLFDDAILPTPVTEVQSRRERVGLIAGLTTKRDQTAWRKSAPAEPFHDDANLSFLDEHGAEHQRPEQQEAKNNEPNNNQNRRGHACYREHYVRCHNPTPMWSCARPGYRRARAQHVYVGVTVEISRCEILEDRPSRCRRG